jgi:hypothetical protein
MTWDRQPTDLGNEKQRVPSRHSDRHAAYMPFAVVAAG